jgi:hypothetical protein
LTPDLKIRSINIDSDSSKNFCILVFDLFRLFMLSSAYCYKKSLIESSKFSQSSLNKGSYITVYDDGFFKMVNDFNDLFFFNFCNWFSNISIDYCSLFSHSRNYSLFINNTSLSLIIPDGNISDFCSFLNKCIKAYW